MHETELKLHRYVKVSKEQVAETERFTILPYPEVHVRNKGLIPQNVNLTCIRTIFILIFRVETPQARQRLPETGRREVDDSILYPIKGSEING